LTAILLSNILKKQSMLSWPCPTAQSKYGQGLMNCKAVFSAAALGAAAYAVTLGAGWSETIAIPSQVEAGKGSDVPVMVNGAGFDRPATSDHLEGGADSLALGGSAASDPMALRGGGESGDNAPDALGSLAAPEPSILTRLLIIVSDLRAQILGGP
jgi:hypothetical protein